MPCSKSLSTKTINFKLTLHSDARSNTGDASRGRCVFTIPDVAMISGNNDALKRVTAQVERFHVSSESGDSHGTLVLMCDSLNQSYTYDVITSNSSKVVAVMGNPEQAPGGFVTTYDMMTPVELATRSVSNMELIMRLCVISTNAGNTYTPVYTEANRIWYAVVNFQLEYE